jgi:hypothetical protein
MNRPARLVNTRPQLKQVSMRLPLAEHPRVLGRLTCHL